MEPNVDHGATYTWHCLSVKYHGFVVGCARSIQKIWFSSQPHFDHRGIHYVYMQWSTLRHLGPMVGIPSTPERGYGQ